VAVVNPMAAFRDERCAQRMSHPMSTPSQVCERHAEDCTRAAEQTDDTVFRKMLLMLALQWTLAAQEEQRCNRGKITIEASS